MTQLHYVFKSKRSYQQDSQPHLSKRPGQMKAGGTLAAATLLIDEAND